MLEFFHTKAIGIEKHTWINEIYKDREAIKCRDDITQCKVVDNSLDHTSMWSQAESTNHQRCEPLVECSHNVLHITYVRVRQQCITSKLTTIRPISR